MPSWLLIFVSLIIVYFLHNIIGHTFSVKVKNHDEFLRFFAPNEKLRVDQVAERIKERTGGRRDVSDYNVRIALSQLCEEGKLVKEIVSHPFGFNSTEAEYYFLPRGSSK